MYQNVFNSMDKMLVCFQANTDVLVGVKAEMGSPSPERPNHGRLEFFVDWSEREREKCFI